MRVGHALYEVGYFSVSIISRTANCLLFGGSMHQTLSARVFVEAQIHGKPAWQRRMKLIDRAWRVLSLGAGSRGHCEDAWASEVSRAERTLELAGGTE